MLPPSPPSPPSGPPSGLNFSRWIEDTGVPAVAGGQVHSYSIDEEARPCPPPPTCQALLNKRRWSARALKARAAARRNVLWVFRLDGGDGDGSCVPAARRT